jgi:hypothetical protein
MERDLQIASGQTSSVPRKVPPSACQLTLKRRKRITLTLSKGRAPSEDDLIAKHKLRPD